MNERWWKIREVLLLARGREPMDGLPEEAIDACAARGWVERHHWVEADRWDVVLTEAGRDAVGYMSDVGAFERAFTWHEPAVGVSCQALPPDVPWRALRARLARERGWEP
jgi:hypothetical protein